MNNFKSCVPCVCTTGSGHKRSCEEQNIGTQCGATTTNTATETVEQSDAINFQKNQKKTAKSAKYSVRPEKSAKTAKFTKTQKTAGGSS